jgi:hypothetical protein
MRLRTFFLMLALVMTSAASVNAQVLIGNRTNGDPHAGAILDLAPPNGQNLGLLLPNVALTGDANEFMLGSGASSDPMTAAGMIVYNTAYVLKGPGIYLWNGTLWMPLSEYCPNAITDERDGNFYCTGDFGDAGTWMTQNLRYLPNPDDGYSDYTHSGIDTYTDKCYAFPRSTGNGEYPANPDELTAIQAAWKVSDDLKKMGVFYNWAAATNGRTTPIPANEGEITDDRGGPTSNVQGVCPSGWHLPSDAEWNDLEGEIALSAGGVYSSTDL